LSNLLKYENVETSRIPYNFIRIKEQEVIETKHSNQTVNIEELINVKNSKNEAKKIIYDANSYAALIKNNAEKQAECDCEKAKAIGYAAGFKSATIEAEKKNLLELEEIKQVLKNLDEQKSKFIAENKQNTIDLAFKVAEKAINQRLSSDDGLFLKIYEKAVKDLTAQKWLKLSISKSEVQIVTTNSEYLLSMVSGAERLEIEVLEKAPKGTCIVETTEKIVDASINTQLEVLHKVMSKA